MNRPESLPDILPALIRRGLPPEYAQRAAAELADHHRDLVDHLRRDGCDDSVALAEASRRLGDERTLVKNTVRGYQRRYFCGRWPLVTFILGPISLLLLMWFASSLALFSIGWLLTKLGVDDSFQSDGIVSFWEWVITVVLVTWFFFVIPAMIAFRLARLSNRAAVGWKFVAVSACLLGIAIGFFNLKFPDTRATATLGNGERVPAARQSLTISHPLSLPSWVSVWRWYTQDVLQVCQALLPLAVVGAVFIRERQHCLHARVLHRAAS